jgi:hypothetical protein
MMPPELVELMQRYNQLGRLLPPEADWELALEDPRALAEAKIVLREMAKAKRAIDDFLAAARAARATKPRSPTKESDPSC